MDDAYTIGITLALENGVSDGLAIIRRDLEALDLAIAHTLGGLAELRRASEAAIAGAGLDLARLAAEGRRLLGGLPSMTAPAPVRRSPEAAGRVEDAATPPSEAAALKPTPAIAIPSAPLREWPPLAVAATVQHPVAPAVPLAPAPAAPSAGINAPASLSVGNAPASLVTSVAIPATMAPHAAPIARETPSRVRVDLPPLNTPVVPPAAAMPPARVAATVPPSSSFSPPASVAPIAERPGSASAPAAPHAIALTVADLSALARGAVPDAVPVSSPAPAQLKLLAVSATSKPVFGPIRPPTALSGAEEPGRDSSSASGWPASGRPADRPSSTVSIGSIVPPRVPSWDYRPEPIAATASIPGPERALEQHGHSPFRAEGPVFLDSHMVGRWMCEHLAREAGRAPAGPTGFDSRAGIVWPGAPIQT